jgi:general secretion pathway protein A
MYCEHYGLLKRPFEMTPDPAFLYLGDAHREGLATLLYGIQSGKGFVVLTGEVGTGKTTLLHALLGQLDSDTESAFLFNPRLDTLDFFAILFDELGIEAPCETKGDYLLALNRFLLARLEKSQATILIIDEAQNLSPEMLEEIRLLSNLETATSKLIQIMLVGQPELNELLARPELRQLRQRVALRHELRAFDAEETSDYIEQRIRRAGFTGRQIFKKSGMREVFRVSEGTPRVINILCDSALLHGYSRDLKTLDAGAVREAANDLGLIPQSPVESLLQPPASGFRKWFGRSG